MTSEIKRAYQVLELEPGAALEQVKQAWREQVKVWHPDRFPNDAKMQHKAQERLKDINGAYEILCQFLEDGTSPRGSRANSSDAKGQQDQKSREAKTEQGAPPKPPHGKRENEPSKSPKWSKAKVVSLLILVVGVLAYGVHIAVKFHEFSRQITEIKGIHIGDSRDEVKYRLGFPPYVMDSAYKDTFGGWRVFTVSASENDINKMPATTKVEDYGEWSYEEAFNNVRLTIEFDKSGLVESLNLYSDGDKTYSWGPIAGLYTGDSEDKVLSLGLPSQQNLNGVSKSIEYRDIGVEVTLSKGRAYMIKVTGPQNKVAIFSRFIRSYF